MEKSQLRAEDLQFRAPSFDRETLVSAAIEGFGIAGATKPLTGERDQNLLISTADDESFVLKVSGHLEDPQVVDLQTQALIHLEQAAPLVPTPRIVPTLAGTNSYELIGPEGDLHMVRLLTFLPGDTFVDLEHLDHDALVSLGRVQGQLCSALGSFEHPASEHFMPWDISNGLVLSDALWAHAGPDVVELCGWTREHLANSAFTLSERRAQVIHNDGHHGNILRHPGTQDLAGVIDFGDLVYAPLTNDLAISAQSFMRTTTDPVDAVVAIASGFHSEIPLTDEELAIVYDSILARAVLTALLFEFQLAECPDRRDYVTAGRPSVMRDLALWLNQSPKMVLERLHEAIEQVDNDN